MERDEQLVAWARAGEREAFDELVRRHSSRVWRIAHSFAVLREETEDLCQEAFLAAFEHLRELREPARFCEWLEAITRNCARGWRRRRFVQPPLLSLEENADMPAPQEPESRGWLREQVARALRALPREQQQLLRLHYLHGYDYQETAALFKLPVAAVRGRLHRARQALRKEWRQMTFDEWPGWEMTGEDLDTVRRAAEFVWTGPEREILKALRFRGGALAATDSYRIFYHKAEAFLPLGTLLVNADLARALGEYPTAQRARVSVEGGDAVLRLESGEELRAPVVEGEFPPVEQVFAHDFQAVSFTATAADWWQALRLLESQRNGAVNTAHGLRVTMSFTPEEARLTLHQGFPAPEEGLPWESSVSFAAQPTPESQGLRMAVNPEFLAAALRGPGATGEDRVEFGASHHLGPLRMQRPGDDNTFALTMPMQLAEEGVEAKAEAEQ